MTNLAGLARACHLGPTLAVTSLVTALAVASGRTPWGCAAVALAILTGQLSIGWCNDAADAVRDTVTGRTGKPIVAGLVSRRAVWSAALTALVLCVPFSFLSGLYAGLAHLLGVGVAWAYDLGLKATRLSWAPYAIAFGILPLFVSLGLPGEPLPAWWSVTAAALLGVGAHLANVLPDIAGDLRTGVRGLPQVLGPARVLALAPVPLLMATGVLVVAPQGPPGAPGWLALASAALLTAAAVPLAARHPKAPFGTAVAVAAIGVALLLLRGI